MGENGQTGRRRSPSPRRRRRSGSATRAGRPTAASPRRTPTPTATAPTGPHRPQRDRREPRRAAQQLTAEGHVFSSETDAEIVSHLIEKHYDGDLTDAVVAAFNDLRGHYAFVAMHADHPDTLVAARQECPLIVGLGEGETFVASAIPAFLADTRIVLGLKNGEIVTVDADGRADHRRRRAPGRARGRGGPLGRGGRREGRLSDLHAQGDPRPARRGRRDDRRPARRSDAGRPLRARACPTASPSASAGSSSSAAAPPTTPAWSVATRSSSGRGSRSRSTSPRSSATATRWSAPSDLVIGITQSGETADTLAAMRLARERGAHVIAVTNVMGSQATRDADSVLFTRAGTEISVAATKTFVSQAAAMYLLAPLARRRARPLVAGSRRRA